MIKEFIPYEQALKLKELGFDELCFGWWNHINGNAAKFYDYKCTNTELVELNSFSKNCTAPIWQQAFDWFREKHKLHYSILGFEYWVAEKIGGFPTGVAKSYEEARLECLKKLIEIVSNKIEK